MPSTRVTSRKVNSLHMLSVFSTPCKLIEQTRFKPYVSVCSSRGAACAAWHQHGLGHKHRQRHGALGAEPQVLHASKGMDASQASVIDEGIVY
jgi:hypothetical protein